MTAAICCLTVACSAGVPGGTETLAPSTAVSSGSSPSVSVPERTVDFQAMERELNRRLRDGGPALKAVRSVLVSVDGETVVSYYHAQKSNEQAHVFSVTKSVISILVGIAIDEGVLRLDETLPELLPAYQAQLSPEMTSITLEQLLTMTAGFANPIPVDSPDTVGEILRYGLVSEPGAQFAYTDAGAHLVAAALAKAINTPILDYAREKLFDPLGIDTRPAWQGWDTGSPGNGFDKPGFAWATDRSGLNLGGLGLKLTAPDMVKLGELYANGGSWRGRRIVSEEWVRESTSLQVTEAQRPDGPYGYFWWLGPSTDHPGFAASGLYGQKIYCIPDRHLVVVVTSAAEREDLAETYLPILDEVIFTPLTS